MDDVDAVLGRAFAESDRAITGPPPVIVLGAPGAGRVELGQVEDPLLAARRAARVVGRGGDQRRQRAEGHELGLGGVVDGQGAQAHGPAPRADIRTIKGKGHCLLQPQPFW